MIKHLLSSVCLGLMKPILTKIFYNFSYKLAKPGHADTFKPTEKVAIMNTDYRYAIFQMTLNFSRFLLFLSLSLTFKYWDN